MRPEKSSPATDIQYFKGVGPVRARALRRLGIETAGDLLQHYPHDYEHPGEQLPLAAVRAGQRVRSCGRVLHVDQRTSRNRRSLVSAMIGEGSARLRLTWFNAPYVYEQLQVGVQIRVAGEVTLYGAALQIVNPEFEIAEDESDPVDGESGPRARYPLSAGLRQGVLRKLIRRALDEFGPCIQDPLPPALLAEEGLPPLRQAIEWVHRPSDHEQIDRARERIAFDEALALQLAVLQRRALHMRRRAHFQLGEFGGLSSRFVGALGFDLTAAQRRALAAIAKDLRREVAMHRLLQGDVGSGKTLVALIPMLWVAEGGAQAAFMAPTEVLARQQAERWLPRLRELGLRGDLLLGSTPAAEKQSILESLRSGECQLLFGTHAMIQDRVRFARLGLAVVDEQHRFGVLQRADLAASGAHLLVMSATPIPRSLGLTVYGDLDLSILDELPAGRQPIQTRLARESDLQRIYEEVLRRARRGERSYLVFPMVEDSETSDLASAKAAYEELRTGALAELRLGLLHGQLPAREKAEISRSFARGELDALVATTVIEVGMDVPEATCMVVHQAERFGLAQLHQMRGRVGRGDKASLCLLVADPGIGEAARTRLQALVRTQDGFELAELDLLQRGMGELHGLRQHGELPFRMLHPLTDEALMRRARARAEGILAEDPELRREASAVLREWLDGLGHRSPLWSAAG